MRRLQRGLLIAAIAMPLVVVAAPPCLACSCAPRSVGAVVSDAEAVFIGEMIGDRLAGEGTIQRFRVDEVFAGTLPPEVELYAPIGRESVNTCGVLFSPGTQVAVAMAYDAEGRPTTDACSYLTPGEVRALGIAGTAPDPAAVVRGIDPIVPPGPGPGPVPWWVIVALGVAGAVALAWIAILAARRSDAREAVAPLPADDDIVPPSDRAPSDPPG